MCLWKCYWTISGDAPKPLGENKTITVFMDDNLQQWESQQHSCIFWLWLQLTSNNWISSCWIYYIWLRITAHLHVHTAEIALQGNLWLSTGASTAFHDLEACHHLEVIVPASEYVLLPDTSFSYPKNIFSSWWDGNKLCDLGAMLSSLLHKQHSYKGVKDLRTNKKNFSLVFSIYNYNCILTLNSNWWHSAHEAWPSILMWWK